MKNVQQSMSDISLLHIFCKIILGFKVIVHSIIDPDDNF